MILLNHMEEKIKKLIKEVLKIKGDFALMHPKDIKNGDYAFVSSSKNPGKDAEALRQAQGDLQKQIEKIEVAGRFINFYLSRKFFANSIEEILNKGEKVGGNNIRAGQKIMVEYTDPNPFKPFHIGHLMTNAIGESIARILEHSGAVVFRANYQGDIGLHVAKAIYGLLKNKKLQNQFVSNALQSANIGKAYAQGAKAYENDKKAEKEIDKINKKIYERTDEKINKLYTWGFDATMEAFENLYKMLGTKFDFYFLESQMAPIGEDIVQANIGKVFEKSDPEPSRQGGRYGAGGAIIFRGEKYDPKLHTRVFITSQGLPTYETKELGLAEEKFRTKPDMDLSIMITANEQMDYMRVVAKAISLIHPDFANRMKHITHGMMRFVGGKMSSRKGNVITGESLLNDAHSAILEKIKERDIPLAEEEKIASAVGVAAVKYSILKQSIGGDIIYDFEKSICFEGDSGPYLQYSYARANSVLEKAHKENILPDFEILPEEIFEVEKLLYRFPEIVLRSASEYEPHYITNYLIEVARAYNSFYGDVIIVNKKDKTSPYKVALTYAFSFVMKTGLHLLGIKAPEKM